MNLAAVHSLEQELSLLLINSGKYLGKIYFTTKILFFKLYYTLAYPHISNHIVVWGAAPISQIKILAVQVNNMLRVILGVVRINGRPALSNDALWAYEIGQCL